MQTTPVDGEVLVDGTSWGTAPQTRTLSPGTYTVSFGSVPGYNTPPDNIVTLAAGDDKTVTGVYEKIQIQTYTLNIIAGNGGTTSPSGTRTYTKGTTVNITASPNYGFVFGKWLIEVNPNRTSWNSESETNPLQLIIDKDITVFAQLKLDVRHVIGFI